MSSIIEVLKTEAEDITSSLLTWDGADEDQLEFMRKVFDINHKWSSAHGTFLGDLPEKELDTIEGSHQAKKEAAVACKDLLAEARQAITDAAVNVKIGITSAYRSASRQLTLWQKYFPDYYKQTSTQREVLPGGAHGDKAVAYLAGYIRPKIAIPGFSNHQNGIAVDLLNVENDEKVLNKTRSPFPAKWRESWFWEWLSNNANKFGFYQNTSIDEPWHWEYRKKATDSHESYLDFENIETKDSIPALIYRDSSPASDTLYVKIDLGLGNERIFKKTDPRNDTAVVQKMTGIFIPKNYRPSDKIDLLIYLHGHKSEPLGKDKSINEYWNAKRFPHFGFREILNESGKNLILVAPTLGPRSQPGNLITGAGFTHFVTKVIASIVEYSGLFTKNRSPEINNIILTCHSGSGFNMYKIAQLAESNEFAEKISECWGYDCTYGPNDADVLYKWAARSAKDSVRSVYIYYRKDSDTEAQAVSLKQLSASLKNVQVNGLPNSADHNLIPAIYMKERLSAIQDAVQRENAGEMETAVEEFEQTYANVQQPMARRKFNAENPIKYNTVPSAAFDLYRRGFISYDILSKIIGGERDLDVLTDMVFDYRHPEKFRLSALVQSSEIDYRRLVTEWNEIRSKIIAPIFRFENGTGTYGEASNITVKTNKETEKHDDAFARMKWFNESRFGLEQRPSREMLVAFKEAREHLRECIVQENLEHLQESFLDVELAQMAGKNNWAPLGPSVIENGQAPGNPTVSGRISSLVVGPGGQRVYIGAANGGIWRSLDEGKTWKPLDDFSNSPDYISDIESDSLSVGSIAVKFGKAANGDDDIIYVGTGEPVGGYLDVFGIGIKRSNKGGAPKTWVLEGRKALEDKGVFKLAIDPDESHKVYAASTKGLYVRDAKGGWTKVAHAAFTKPDDAVTDFLITGTGTSKEYYAAFRSSGVYRSADSGKTWALVTGISSTSTSRKEMAAGESSPNIIYVLDQNTNLFRLDSSKTPLNFESVNLNSLPVFGQGSYNLIIGVDPANANTVYMAGAWVREAGTFSLNLYKGSVTPSTGAFKFSFSFNSANASKPEKDPTYVGTGIHPDGHALAFALNSSGTKHDGNRVWVACDGGLFYSNSGGGKGSYKSMNDGLAITQMTYLSQSPDIPTVIFGGCQDNGTVRLWGNRKWYETAQGDGGGVAVDPSNPMNVMRQYTYASLDISTDGGQTWNSVKPPLDDHTSAESSNTRFYAPIVAFPGSSSTMWLFGSYRLWLSENNGTSWKTLPSNTSPASNTTDSLGFLVTDVKVVSKDLIYATTNESVYRYVQSSGAWARTTNTPDIKDWKGNAVTSSDYFINAIDSEGTSANNFYIALGGKGSFSRCYYYDGTKWYPCMSKADKLAIPCSAIVVDPDHPHIVYLGSDVGVWKGTKSKTKNSWTWEHFSFGLPECVILDLVIHPKGRLLRAGTHGRGVWEIAVDPTSNKPVDLYMRLNQADNGRIDPRTKKRFDWSITGKGVPDPYSPGKFLLDAFSSPDIESGPFTKGSTPITRVFVHNRGWKSVNAKGVRVCLLMAVVSDTGSVPLLPKDFSSRITKGEEKKWLDGSGWVFADPMQPYANISTTLDAHSSGSVSFGPDITPLTFSSVLGFKRVCLLAFVLSTDGSSPLTATNTDVDQLVLSDNHVAYKKVFVL